MGINQLNSGEALKKEKLFNEREFSTIIVNRDGFSKKENEAADLIGLLLGGTNRTEYDQILKRLKELKASRVVTEAIREVSRPEDKAKLASAGWESGLDFSEDILFYTELTCQEDFNLAFESLTLVENMSGPFTRSQLDKALELAGKCQSPNSSVVEDLIDNLSARAAAINEN